MMLNSNNNNIKIITIITILILTNSKISKIKEIINTTDSKVATINNKKDWTKKFRDLLKQMGWIIPELRTFWKWEVMIMKPLKDFLMIYQGTIDLNLINFINLITKYKLLKL